MRDRCQGDCRFDGIQVSSNAGVVCGRSPGPHAQGIDRLDQGSVTSRVVNERGWMGHIIVAASAKGSERLGTRACRLTGAEQQH